MWLRLSRGKTHLLCAIAAVSLAGCAVVDLYSERATVYNVESEQAHDQGVLLNIVRASQRRPRAYTLVQKITGQASATGGIGVSFPFGSNITGPNTGTANASVIGGPTFEVATLETHDFFAGLIEPIPQEIFDLYIHGQFPPDLLFNLFIAEIVINKDDPTCDGTRKHLPQCELALANYPGIERQLQFFQTLAGYLVFLGLSTEQIPPPKPPGMQGNGTKPDTGTKNSGDKDSQQNPSTFYTFCFAPRYPSAAKLVEPNAICGTRTRRDGWEKSGKMKLGTVSSLARVTLSRDLINVLKKIADTHPDRQSDDAIRQFLAGYAGAPVNMTIYTRSTETAIYYIGEVVRRQLYPDFEPAGGHVQIKIPQKSGPHSAPFVPCGVQADPGCTDIFVLDKNARPVGRTAFSINYQGDEYSIPDNPGAGASYQTRAGASYSILSILRQLVIYNTNAKSLPATSVLAISAGP